MRHYGLQALRDRRQQPTEIEIRNQRVVNLQQELRPIAFPRKLLLLKLGLDSNGYLSGNQLREFEVQIIVGAGLLAPESHDAELLMRSRHGQAAN